MKRQGNGRKAREGLLRAYFSDRQENCDAGEWNDVSRLYRRLMGMALEKKAGRAVVETARVGKTKNTREVLESGENETVLKDLGIAKMLHCRVRYFTDGAVIGSREFVDEVFAAARERFGPKRKNGARKLRGVGNPAAETLWSLRDLRVGIL